MQVRDLDTVSAGEFARAAFLNAKMTSVVNSSHFNDAQKLLAERMKLALGMVYSSRAVHLNYRKKQITLKVDQPTVRDRKMLKVLEADWIGSDQACECTRHQLRHYPKLTKKNTCAIILVW